MPERPGYVPLTPEYKVANLFSLPVDDGNQTSVLAEPERILSRFD